MMIRITVAILFLICSTSVRAQIYKPVAFPEKVDSKYIINPLAEYEKYFKKIRKSIPKKEAESFAAAQVYGKAEKFSNGQIYLSWPEMEDYLNQLLDSILPSTLANKNINAFIGRSSDINAYCLYDGTMIVNVGLLAEVKNEAALVAIMGHELGHFMKNHHLNRLKKLMAKRKSKDLLEEKLNYMGFSQKSELEADQIGFDITKGANYDLNEAASNFELFAREEEYYRKRRGSTLASTDSVTINTKSGKFKANTLEKLLSTHPDLKDRKGKLADYVKSNSQKRKDLFKLREDRFKKLQSQARLESVGLIFDDNNYSECLERAFIYHLYNPSEVSYQYYIAESIRRLCLLDFRVRKKGFLSENLISEGFEEGQGILKDLHFLVPNADKFKEIKASELLSEKHPYETYKDAFDYYTDKLITAKYQEAHLMRALFENNKSKIKKNVDLYLADVKAEHKEYARHYENGTLAKAIEKNTGEIVMVPQVGFYRHPVYNSSFQSYATEFNYGRTEIEGKQMADDFSKAFNAGLQDTKAISLPRAARENFNTKYKYENVIETSLLASRDENEGYEVVHYYKELEDEDYVGQIDIFRLSPDIWEFFRSNQINAITFSNFSRHKSIAANRLRITYCFIPVIGWVIAPFVVTNYKRLQIFTYDARLGTLYHDYEIRSYKLRTNKALKMYRGLKKSREEFILDYNKRY